MKLQAIPYIILLGFFFGSTLVASRFSVGQLHTTNYIGLRLVLASLGHLSIYLFNYRNTPWPTKPRLWRQAALLGLMGTAIPMTSIVGSLNYQSAGVTAILLTMGPAITVLLAHFFLQDEQLTWRKGFGIALALSGGILLALRGETGLSDLTQANPIGYGLVFLALLCGSSMAIYARKFMHDLKAFDVASIRMFTAALIVMPLSILFVGLDLHQVNFQGYIALGYASLVGTFGGMFLAFYIVKQFGATASAMPQYIIPIFAGLGGFFILGEQVTGGMMVGMALIIIGIVLIRVK